jgi:hypothetical protein
MYSMRLEAGDLQLLSNHTALHSRTEFRDDEDENKKRTLYRLWLSMPDAPPIPASMASFWGSTESAVVRGGIEGHCYDDVCRKFDRRSLQCSACASSQRLQHAESPGSLHSRATSAAGSDIEAALHPKPCSVGQHRQRIEPMDNPAETGALLARRAAAQATRERRCSG